MINLKIDPSIWIIKVFNSACLSSSLSVDLLPHFDLAKSIVFIMLTPSPEVASLSHIYSSSLSDTLFLDFFCKGFEFQSVRVVGGSKPLFDVLLKHHPVFLSDHEPFESKAIQQNSQGVWQIASAA